MEVMYAYATYHGCTCPHSRSGNNMQECDPVPVREMANLRQCGYEVTGVDRGMLLSRPGECHGLPQGRNESWLCCLHFGPCTCGNERRRVTRRNFRGGTVGKSAVWEGDWVAREMISDSTHSTSICLPHHHHLLHPSHHEFLGTCRGLETIWHRCVLRR